MLIKINKKIIEISDNLTKLSPYINNLHKLGRTIPISGSIEIFEIFKEWFDVLNDVGIVENLDNEVKSLNRFCSQNTKQTECNLIFFPNFFIQNKKINDIQTFLKLYELGIFNQINLLSNTITFIFSKYYFNDKNISVRALEDKVYFINLLSKKIYNGEISFKYDETDLTGIEFDIIKRFRDTQVINYHPSIFDDYKFICDFKRLNEAKETLKILKLSEDTSAEINQQIAGINDNYIKNISNYDSVIIKNYTGDLNNFIDCCKIITVFEEVNEEIFKINSVSVSLDIVKYFIDIRKQTQYRPQFRKDKIYILDEDKKFIKSHAFENMKVEKVILPSGLCYIGNSAFKNCGKILLCSKDKQGIIHENAISPDVIIKDEAFNGCELPEGLKEQILKMNDKAFDSNDVFEW